MQKAQTMPNLLTIIPNLLLVYYCRNRPIKFAACLLFFCQEQWWTLLLWVSYQQCLQCGGYTSTLLNLCQTQWCKNQIRIKVVNSNTILLVALLAPSWKQPMQHMNITIHLNATLLFDSLFLKPLKYYFHFERDVKRSDERIRFDITWILQMCFANLNGVALLQSSQWLHIFQWQHRVIYKLF